MTFAWFGFGSNLSFRLSDYFLVNCPTGPLHIFLLLFSSFFFFAFDAFFAFSNVFLPFIFFVSSAYRANTPPYSTPNLDCNVDLLRNNRSIELPPWDKWQGRHLHCLALSSDFDLKCFR